MGTDKPLISVVVPVYKTEAYLRQCVDSLLMQTYPNLEIILVDDGSPDGSGAVCDQYARRDARICVIHQKNGGVSAARNAGVQVATGQYIAFVDSDDWVDPDYVKTLFQAAERLSKSKVHKPISGQARKLYGKCATKNCMTRHLGESCFGLKLSRKFLFQRICSLRILRSFAR